MKGFRSRLLLSAAILMGGLAGVALPAAAQTDQQYPGATDVTPPSGQRNVPSPTVPPPPPAQTSSSPFEGITAFGKNLADKGVYLQLGYTYDFNANVSGGNYTGVAPTGELYFGTVLDLQKLFGIRGASFHITFDERSGYGLNGYVGTQGPLEANSGPTRATRLSEFYWEQAFDNDRLDITVGRTNPTLDFATNDIACEFISSIICAQPGSWYFSNDNDAYPASTWGSRINFVPAPNYYIRTGAFEDNPSQLGPNQNGFNWNVE
ncbi:MAG TPA: carbohydrate porin, partial [Rhodopila sp.]|nr:carbohydrate porin [Rhodopila sp.]